MDQSNRQARDDGFADRIRFYHRNAFDADLREATVVTMWLFPGLMRLLRPIILERARPGTRVLTSMWDLGSWPPDAVSEWGGPKIRMWIVPARVAGPWQWDLDIADRRVRYTSFKEQQFQSVEGVARANQRRELLHQMRLRGADLAFTLHITLDGLGLTMHEFSGTVRGDTIEGTVKLTPPDQSALTLAWRARRTGRSGYFAPTGTPPM